MKNGTSPKTLRIPNDTIADIERVAKEKKITFSKEAIHRLQNKNSDDKNFPLLLAKTQTIINLSIEGAETGNVEMVNKAKEEVKKLWERKLISSK
ncbi:hypothetical protein [uncultured Ruminococcus sp.]|uniref:hypothetical protein n=1 Tax=uncultured Ruminococcus sp. TaxID=165186 RepID=UPI0025FAE375|nr:hypothetical protein [uncultured Ruminococcus sp.]